MEWSKKRLGELLPGTEAPATAAGAGASAGAGEPWVARVTEVKSVTGEVRGWEREKVGVWMGK